MRKHKSSDNDDIEDTRHNSRKEKRSQKYQHSRGPLYETTISSNQ